MNADVLKKFNLTEEELSDLASRLTELLKKRGAFMVMGFVFCISAAMGASTH
jgi:hypothetical protein